MLYQPLYPCPSYQSLGIPLIRAQGTSSSTWLGPMLMAPRVQESCQSISEVHLVLGQALITNQHHTIAMTSWEVSMWIIINHHKPWSTSINHYQPSATSITQHEPASTITTHDQPLTICPWWLTITAVHWSTIQLYQSTSQPAGSHSPPAKLLSTATCPNVENQHEPSFTIVNPSWTIVNHDQLNHH